MIAVIGAGVGGLAVAARLAAGGHRVTVFEKSDTVGGKLGEWSRDGFRFDTGPSLLTLPQVLTGLFAEIGRDFPLELRRLDPVARYRFADGQWFSMYARKDARDEALDDAFGDGSARRWNAFMARAGAIWQATRGPFLESTVDGWTLVRQAVHVRDLATIAPWRSLRSLARHYLPDPRMRMLVDRYATYTGSDPRQAPAALASIPYIETAYGGWYVEGGLRKIADALLELCLSLGVDVRTGSEVSRIAVTSSGVTGVEVGGRVFRASTVVANVDADRLYGELLPVSSEIRKLRRVQRSLSGFVLLLGLRDRTPGLGHHTVLFPRDYDAEFDAIFGRDPRPVEDPTIYVANPTGDALFVLVNAPGQDQLDWRALSGAYAQTVLSRLAERGFEVRDRILFTHTISPAELEERTGAVGGAIYGTSSNGPRAAFLRPANRSVVPGLFLVGGSAHPGGGLPLVLLSAQITAGLIGPA
ncbi:phytoene desaturase family protein [Fodinicola acaciae]|uniref:phytoene desaturase family protein n=1 Tax=Fodinicola acaciae TaxID=2681555 RepID=UPI0031B61A8B